MRRLSEHSLAELGEAIDQWLTDEGLDEDHRELLSYFAAQLKRAEVGKIGIDTLVNLAKFGTALHYMLWALGLGQKATLMAARLTPVVLAVFAALNWEKVTALPWDKLKTWLNGNPLP